MLILLLSLLFSSNAHAFTVLNLNIFDQLQGDWDKDFRGKRMHAVAGWIQKNQPDVVVFQEAQGRSSKEKNKYDDTSDADGFKNLYPFHAYVHEMVGKDGESYGYYMAAKEKPQKIWHEGFFFPGGVERKTEAMLWQRKKSCVGILSLHLSYQSSAVRKREAHWVLDWIKEHEDECRHWIVVGDFNADENDTEMKILFRGGLRSLFQEQKPTVGAFNPIRQIYGKDVPSQTVDWALGSNLSKATATVIFDRPLDGIWVSDHAGILVQLP